MQVGQTYKLKQTNAAVNERPETITITSIHTGALRQYFASPQLEDLYHQDFLTDFYELVEETEESPVKVGQMYVNKYGPARTYPVIVITRQDPKNKSVYYFRHAGQEDESYAVEQWIHENFHKATKEIDDLMLSLLNLPKPAKQAIAVGQRYLLKGASGLTSLTISEVFTKPNGSYAFTTTVSPEEVFHATYLDDYDLIEPVVSTEPTQANASDTVVLGLSREDAS